MRVEVNAEVAEFEQVHADDGIGILGEFGILHQATNEHGDGGTVDWAELKFGKGGGLPFEFSVEVEALSRPAIEVEPVGDFPVDDGDGRAGIEDELQVGLRADAAFDLDEIARSNFERQFARRGFGRVGLSLCLCG